jgi:hypothetical protein
VGRTSVIQIDQLIYILRDKLRTGHEKHIITITTRVDERRALRMPTIRQ